MTPTEIATAASRLGIRLTRSPVGSEIWEAWADRVREADMYASQFKAADLLVGAKNRVNARALAIRQQGEAIKAANAYAV